MPGSGTAPGTIQILPARLRVKPGPRREPCGAGSFPAGGTRRRSCHGRGRTGAHCSSGVPEQDLHRRQRLEDEPVVHLERGQLATETSRPVPRAALSARAATGLWALRAFAVPVSLMVIFTFLDQLLAPHG